ncbi:MAG: hypothetical protein HYR52_05510 [Candidatus Tectomicrobia bacterium]|nr:hypothetical protein [Candidatus Tectomicrobia bacterium]
MSIHLSGTTSRPPEPEQFLAADLPAPAARVRSSLGSGRPCPFLGSQDGAGLANNSPSRMNMCHAHSRKEWKGMRRVTIPYSRVTREKQAEVCFAAFNQCPYHRQASQELAEKHHAPRAEAGHAGPRQKKRRPARRNSAPMSGRARAIVRYGGLGLGALACAFIVSLVISAEPGRMFDFVFEVIAFQDIKAMGVGHKGLDKRDVSGLVTGGDLKAMQHMSGAQKDKLKSSAQFKNLSEADKQKLKEKYKAMMGK